MGGGGDIVMPQQQSYGESLAEALKAQAEFLQGTGAFEETGSLESLLPLEESVRKKTAQTDTDVLRTTLLGTEKQMQVQQDPDTGKFGIAGAKVVTDADGNPQTAGGGRYQIVKLSESTEQKTSVYGIIDTETGGVAERFGGEEYLSFTRANGKTEYFKPDRFNRIVGTARQNSNGMYEQNGKVYTRGGVEAIPLDDGGTPEELIKKTSAQLTKLQETIDTDGQDAVAQEFTFTNPNIPTDASKAGQPGYDDKGNRLLEGGQNVADQTITVREGDGLVDLLGDTREIVDFQTRQATEADVAAGLATEVGENITEAVQTGRQAGFSDTGEFQGAAALAEDIVAGSTSRQRERDIADVERLSGRFKTIMDEFKPAAATGIQEARDLIVEQKDKLTGDGNVITKPEKIGEDGSYNLVGEAGLEQVAGGDTLRAMLLDEAKKGLREGLTEREQARIRDAFKGQSTMMGRTFDQSAGIAEAEAQMKEDNLRRLQNLGIAQSQLGQEAGLQAGDIARTMSADQFNVATQMDAETKNEQLRQQGLANYIAAVGNLAQIEDQYTLDPFRAILGRGASDTLGAGQGVVGQAGYGLQSAPQYLNPEAGLGYISQMAANNANIAAAQGAASGSTLGGLFQGLGSLGGGIAQGFIGCWVAREVYGPTNPSWLRFRLWMFSKSPDWFFKLYNKYGERFASWISDKPRIKSFIRKWMDSKIKE